MNMKESGEMYLESILVLSEEQKNVRSVDICRYMHYSRPSVSRAVGLLKDEGYITVDEEGYICLTETGRCIATSIYERHRVIAESLIKLGVCAETASADACRIEHVISAESFHAIKSHLERIGL